MASTFVTPRRRPSVTPRSGTTDDPANATVTPRERTPLTPLNTQPRKQYRKSKRIPRQTLYNRKKRKLSLSRDSLHDGSEISMEETDANTVTDDLQHQLDDNPLDDIFSGDLTTPDLSLSIRCDGSSSDENLEAKQYLFSGSTISVHTSSLLIQSFMCRHHMTYQAKADLLQLLQIHLPDQNHLPSTLYSFQKMNSIRSVDVDPVLIEPHHYCSQCNTVLSDQTSSICSQCGVPLAFSASPHFITVSIADQVKVFLKRPGFYQSLKWKQSDSLPSDCISDIYDGELYKALSGSDGPLVAGKGLSFTLNTDGVDCFHSTRESFWPVLLMINELPFNMRRQPKNMILAGLWFDSNKPPMHMYLKPIFDMLLDLEKTGVEVDVPGMANPFVMTAHVICCSCDLPGKALVQNILQFNGAYGCGFCEQPGKNLRTNNGGNVRIFPYQTESPKGKQRTADACLQYAKEAVETNTTVKGAKGPSWLFCLKHFDFVKSVSPEYMHCTLLGVTKTLLYLWTDKNRCRNTLHDLYPDISLLNERLSQISVPSEIRRKPRGICDKKHWKASEFRSWTLYYGLPVLKGILHTDYVNHFALLSEGLWLLLQTSPSIHDIDKAERLLQQFCFKYATYYGERYYTANVHQLLHLADSAQYLGPLWAHSTFPFEDTNGWLCDLLNGTRNPDKQIVKAFVERQKLSAEAETVLHNNQEDDGAYDFLKRTLNTGHRYKITADVGKGHKVLGRVMKYTMLSTTELNKLTSDVAEVDVSKCIVYGRVLLSGVLYTSALYHRSEVTNDSVVRLRSAEIGTIQKFLSCCKKGCTECCESTYCEHYIIVTIHRSFPFGLVNQTTETTAQHIVQLGNSAGLKMYPTNFIRSKCVVIRTEEAKYATELPNFKENNL